MRLILIFLSLLVILPAQAHMVTYKDGITISSMMGPDFGIFKTSYTFHPIMSVSYERFSLNTTNSDPDSLSLVQFNVRAKRWNRPDSQGNIYLGGGYGEDETSSFQAEADWEDREYYIWSSYRSLDSEKLGYNSIKKLRLGMSPYVANAGAIHTWLIMEYENNSFLQKPEGLTPLIRLFYQNVLLEFGSSFDHDFKFNFMLHM